MLKFMCAVVVGAALLVATQAIAEGAGRRCCRCGGATYHAGVAYAPAYQAAAPGGYRSFSYEPGMAAPVYQFYSSPVRSSRTRGHSYENAINKSMGRVN